ARAGTAGDEKSMARIRQTARRADPRRVVGIDGAILWKKVAARQRAALHSRNWPVERWARRRRMMSAMPCVRPSTWPCRGELDPPEQPEGPTPLHLRRAPA